MTFGRHATCADDDVICEGWMLSLSAPGPIGLRRGEIHWVGVSGDDPDDGLYLNGFWLRYNSSELKRGGTSQRLAKIKYVFIHYGQSS